MNYVVIIAISILVLIYPVLLLASRFRGRYDGLKGRPLNNHDIKAINNNGIVHFTTSNKINKIIESGIIKPSNVFNSYSNKGKPCSFFLVYDYITEESVNHNLVSDKNFGLHFKNIDPNQLEHFNIRLYDNAIFYINGAFPIGSLDCSRIQRRNIVPKLKKTEHPYCKYYSWCCAISSVVLAAVVIIIPLFIFGMLIYYI
ncbi:hypothetical protein RFF05_04100 [Bengtsoniella intestinalis]|uniref:hypothetical protein n=1 Tax=Bengtsoniella intestinalis TaxID=3073143 RepID=UPI00391F4FE4